MLPLLIFFYEINTEEKIKIYLSIDRGVLLNLILEFRKVKTIYSPYIQVSRRAGCQTCALSRCSRAAMAGESLCKKQGSRGAGEQKEFIIVF